MTFKRRLDELTDRVMFEITSCLALAHQIRPLPSIIQRWRDKVEAALLDALLMGQANAHAEMEAAKTAAQRLEDDELADTRPVKTRPPPASKG